ncbi:MAG: hypothetical protein HY069_03170 [Chlamydiia bacterium]|nr:hypothetical protein [Chlamydiia bacterium]
MQLSRAEKGFIFLAMLICFCIGAEYAISRPASISLFVSTFSAAAIPWAWLATVPLNLAAVYLYNRFLPRMGPWNMVAIFIGLILTVHVACGAFLSSFPKLIFLQYVWKDLYILFMFKQLWSLIHATIAESRAKYLYGIIFGCGTLGSIMGSIVPGFFAVDIGSEQLFYLSIPIYLVALFCYRWAFRLSGVETKTYPTEDPRPREGVQMILRNRVLLSILLLVVFMQISVALVEYQFNTHLELSILEKDIRTAYCAKILGITNFLSAALQLIGSYFLVHFLGTRRTHQFIPLLLLSSAALSFAIPSFVFVSFSFIFVKAIDFSLFGVVREMLYIPLKFDEKYRAKAVIDVFAYRTAKAFISLLLLSLQLFLGERLLQLASWMSVALFAVWFLFVLFFLRLDEKSLMTD